MSGVYGGDPGILLSGGYGGAEARRESSFLLDGRQSGMGVLRSRRDRIVSSRVCREVISECPCVSMHLWREWLSDLVVGPSTFSVSGG